MFERQIAKHRGKKVAQEYHKQTGLYVIDVDTLYHIAFAHGWCVEAGDIRWHTYLEVAMGEMERLASKDGVEIE